jgi:hypothetical protein
MSKTMIDQIFRRLSQSPRGLDCSNAEVLAALGLLAATIMRVAYNDPKSEAERFCRALKTCVDDRMLKAKLLELRPSLN